MWGDLDYPHVHVTGEGVSGQSLSLEGGNSIMLRGRDIV